MKNSKLDELQKRGELHQLLLDFLILHDPAATHDIARLRRKLKRDEREYRFAVADEIALTKLKLSAFLILDEIDTLLSDLPREYQDATYERIRRVLAED